MDIGVMELGRCWVWLLATLQAISVYGAELSSEACREMGFSSNLLCSSCDLLGQFSLSQLDPLCRKCCQEEAQSETRKKILAKQMCKDYKEDNTEILLQRLAYALTVAVKTVSSTQGLFLKCVDENWEGSLKFRYVRGSDPVLKLLDDSGNIAEELSILKWNTDSVEEFLSEKLERL